jgi:hypothetical protein
MTPVASVDSAKVSISTQTLSPEESRTVVGHIYLYANLLLREPLKLEHVKPRKQ